MREEIRNEFTPKCHKIRFSFIFQQNNDPKHTGDIVKHWFLYNVPKQLRMHLQQSNLNSTAHQ